MDLEIPEKLQAFLRELDEFIEREIRNVAGHMFGYVRRG